MSLGGGQTISPVADSNKYAQIMELMRMRQNTTPGSSYTGGFNSSAPASVSAAPSNYYEELLRQQALLMPIVVVVDVESQPDQATQRQVPNQLLKV
jgi:hypothetical protein